jgi:hypothetical protein
MGFEQGKNIEQSPNITNKYTELKDAIGKFGEDIIGNEQKNTLLGRLEKIQHSPDFQEVCWKISDAIKICDGQNAATMRATIEKFIEAFALGDDSLKLPDVW